MSSLVKYLGVSILAGRSFNINLQLMRQKFFRALNGILGKVGGSASESLTLSLISTFCLPIMMYACEAIWFSKKSLLRVEKAFNQVFSKMFRSFDTQTIKHCKFYMGSLPMSMRIHLRQLEFLNVYRRGSIQFSLELKNILRGQVEEIVGFYEFGKNTLESIGKKSLRKPFWDFFTRDVFG